jgi:hypothetical protein
MRVCARQTFDRKTPLDGHQKNTLSQASNRSASVWWSLPRNASGVVSPEVAPFAKDGIWGLEIFKIRAGNGIFQLKKG